MDYMGFRSDSALKTLPVMRNHSRHGLSCWVRKTFQRRAWKPTPIFLPVESPLIDKPGSP